MAAVRSNAGSSASHAHAQAADSDSVAAARSGPCARPARPPRAAALFCCARCVLSVALRAPRPRQPSVSEAPHMQPLLVLVLRPHGADLLLM